MKAMKHWFYQQCLRCCFNILFLVWGILQSIHAQIWHRSMFICSLLLNNKAEQLFPELNSIEITTVWSGVSTSSLIWWREDQRKNLRHWHFTTNTNLLDKAKARPCKAKQSHKRKSCHYNGSSCQDHEHQDQNCHCNPSPCCWLDISSQIHPLGTDLQISYAVLILSCLRLYSETIWYNTISAKPKPSKTRAIQNQSLNLEE